MKPMYLKKLPLLLHVRLLGYQAGHHLAETCRSRPAANRPTGRAVCGSPGGHRRHRCPRRPRLQGPSQRYDVVVYALQKWHLSPAEKSRLVSSKSKDGNGAGSDRVECLGTRNRNPNRKSESDPKTDSGENPSPKPKPAGTRNPTD